MPCIIELKKRGSQGVSERTRNVFDLSLHRPNAGALLEQAALANLRGRVLVHLLLLAPSLALEWRQWSGES